MVLNGVIDHINDRSEKFNLYKRDQNLSETLRYLLSGYL